VRINTPAAAASGTGKMPFEGNKNDTRLYAQAINGFTRSDFWYKNSA